MGLTYRVLGEPGEDNALWVEIDRGQGVTKLLFDCGQDCLRDVSFGEIQEVDALLFSHQHIDHIAGFDSYFRCLFDRTTKDNVIWGPPGTAEVMQHRFRGFLWNLNSEMKGSWWIHEVHPDQISRTQYKVSESFATGHTGEALPLRGSRIIETVGYTVDALAMDHLTTTLAYIVREQPRVNVSKERLREHGIRPGPWMQQLKAPPAPDKDAQIMIEIGEQRYSLQQLRDLLMVETPGDAIAYLTDFMMDEQAKERLCEALQGVPTVICESQYRHDDLDRALANYHMTTTLAAEMAKAAAVERLVLFHLSRRYKPPVWQEMLQEAQAIFPNTSFPPHWSFD